MSKGLIPNQIIEEVRSKHDIVDVIGRYVTLKKKGRNFFGKCPFHSEKTPSFAVSAERQTYHCFGCGAGGNVYSFIMEYEGLNFVETVKKMASEVGVEIVHEEHEVGQILVRKKMIEAHELAAKYYNHLLNNAIEGNAAKQYLLDRGFNKKTISNYMLGYAPAGWSNLQLFLEKRGFEKQLLHEAGLLSKSDNNRFFDRFRERIMFPIHDHQGNIVAFGGRSYTADNEPKYLNTSDTTIFNKSNILFNINKARVAIRQAGEMLVFEGYADVIMAAQYGIENAVATMGTALTDEQARLARRLVEKVIVVYDGDHAGREAAIRSAVVLENASVDVSIAVLPDNNDPDDFLRNHTLSEWDKLLDNSIPRVQMQLQLLRANFNFNQEEGNVKYLHKALEILATIEQATKIEHYINKLARELDLSVEAIKSDYVQIKKQQKRQIIIKNNKEKYKNESIQLQKNINPKVNKSDVEAERIILWSLINYPEYRKVIQEIDGTSFIEPNHVLLASELFKYLDSLEILSVGHLLDMYHEQKEICKLLTKLEFEISELHQDKIDLKQLKKAINTIKRRQAQEELNLLKKQLELITADQKKSDNVQKLLKEIQTVQIKINQLS